VKHEKRQDNDVFEHECNRRLRSCVQRQNAAQFMQERNIRLNNSLNEQFYERQTHLAHIEQRDDDFSLD
jgi:ribosomal protein L31E